MVWNKISCKILSKLMQCSSGWNGGSGPVFKSFCMSLHVPLESAWISSCSPETTVAGLFDLSVGVSAFVSSCRSMC